ncbi:MAG: hypothetical protein WBW69_14610 [Candidatus Korobacteraceae bacterium]
MVGVSLVADSPSPKVKTELLSEEPTPALVVHKNSADGQQGVTPDIVAVIEAAAEAFVGRKVCILSIRMIGDVDGDSNAWASQGRDMIQTSHNLVQRGH